MLIGAAQYKEFMARFQLNFHEEIFINFTAQNLSSSSKLVNHFISFRRLHHSAASIITNSLMLPKPPWFTVIRPPIVSISQFTIAVWENRKTLEAGEWATALIIETGKAQKREFYYIVKWFLKRCRKLSCSLFLPARTCQTFQRHFVTSSWAKQTPPLKSSSHSQLWAFCRRHRRSHVAIVLTSFFRRATSFTPRQFMCEAIMTAEF